MKRLIAAFHRHPSIVDRLEPCGPVMDEVAAPAARRVKRRLRIDPARGLAKRCV